MQYKIQRKCNFYNRSIAINHAHLYGLIGEIRLSWCRVVQIELKKPMFLRFP